MQSNLMFTLCVIHEALVSFLMLTDFCRPVLYFSPGGSPIRLASQFHVHVEFVLSYVSVAGGRIHLS